nr:putative nuclease HARBI1 [Crassostrea gigas]
MAAFMRVVDEQNPLDAYNDLEIIQRYRLDRQSIISIIDLIKDRLERPTQRSVSLPVSLQVFATLRFLGSGTQQRLIGDTLGISKSSVCRSIEDVTNALSASLQNIKFPTSDIDLTRTKVGFHSIAGFPNVLGAIDGTHIAITAPSTDEHLYICRKGYHSINVQAIVDADMKFLSIVSKWPGSTHDAFVWANSSIARRFESGQVDGWLLGDSGYPLRPWLLTPVNRPSCRGEERYNRSHRRSRVVVEQAFGVLKSRFRCLHKTGGVLDHQPTKCCKIIFVCCQLHNICIDKHLPVSDIPEELPEDENDVVYQGPVNDGKSTRDQLIRQRFS